MLKEMVGENKQERYRAITLHNIHKESEWNLLDKDIQRHIRIVSHVLPFRTNRYVVRELINWRRVPNDPLFQLTFPQKGMLDDSEYVKINNLIDREEKRDELEKLIRRIRLDLNPHPAGQMTHNACTFCGRALPGLQHKYHETVLFFPARGQTCHAYCTYCFRWAQFVGMEEIKFEARETEDALRYLRAHLEVTDVLVTGGDPMIMKTKILRHYLTPFLNPSLGHIKTIRIGTKAGAYWPGRFVTDDDAEDCLRFFEEIIAAGKHLAIMGHYTHPVELQTEIAQKAIANIRNTGAVIRTQTPLIRHVNDSAALLKKKWQKEINLGLIPYYLFIERDTGARNYFEIPLGECLEIFNGAQRHLSGLGRKIDLSMSAFPGKVGILGVINVGTRSGIERALVLRMIQARNEALVNRIFLAKFDERTEKTASWFTDLKPLYKEDSYFFQSELNEKTSCSGGFDA